MNLGQNSLGVSLLTAAVRSNDVKGLRKLLKKRCHKVHIRDKRDWTLLHEAAALGHHKCLRILLKAGAKVDATNFNGETPLFIACEYCHVDCVKILLMHNKRSVNISNNQRVTPLHMSCTKHCFTIVKLLLRYQANINVEDKNGNTPLDEAIWSTDYESCKLLIEKGANINTRDCCGNTPLHFASISGNIDVLKLLLTSYKFSENFDEIINNKNHDDITPLILAVQREYVEIIKELLSCGANPNVPVSENLLVLHIALETNSLETLKCVYYATSRDAIIKYCTVTENELQNYSSFKSFYIPKSLVCLATNSDKAEFLEFILNCGLSFDVLNCPVIRSRNDLSNVTKDMRMYGTDDYLMDDRYISDRIILHPISYLLYENLANSPKDTYKFLKIMLESGLKFDDSFYKTDAIVLHPLVIAFLESMSVKEEELSIVVECFKLMLDHGISPDYVSETISPKNPIPNLFVFACRLGFVEVIPYLLKYSNKIEIDDLLKWIIDDILKGAWQDDLLKIFQHFRMYTSTSIISKCKAMKTEHEVKQMNDYFSLDSYEVPSLKTICRTVIRKTVRNNCQSCPHRFKIKLNSLGLPPSLLPFINNEELFNNDAEEL